MINRELINPQSIVVVGGSNNVHKPGGRLVRNLLDGKYKGELYVVNAKEDDVQGLKSYHSVHDIPETELAIISIPGPACPEAVDVLAKQKNVKAFIVISAGFGEETHEGAILEEQMLKSINEAGASLIGPNCIIMVFLLSRFPNFMQTGSILFPVLAVRHFSLLNRL